MTAPQRQRDRRAHEGTCYLIHFDTPYRHARHYLGAARNLEARLGHHRSGTGARLLAVIQAAGIGWRVVRTWGGGFATEASLKRQHNTPRLCPVCSCRTGAQEHAPAPALDAA